MITNEGVKSIAARFGPWQRSVGLHKEISQRQQPANFFSGVAALPALGRSSLIQQDHALLAVLWRTLPLLQRGVLLHRHVLKLFALVKLL